MMIDTLIRYKDKGSMSGIKENNPEILIDDLLENLEIPFEIGDLAELIDNAFDNKRTMDFIIPNKAKSLNYCRKFVSVTTSSGQGDKSKTEISIRDLFKSHYPKSIFVGFRDGFGWCMWKNDLKRMVTAYEDVFTFHEEWLQTIEKLVIEKVKNA